MNVLVQLPDGQKTHYVQEPDGVRNLHMQVPDVMLFYDDFSKFTGADVSGQSASKVGSWKSVPTRKGSIHRTKFITSSKVYIHSDLTNASATGLEAVPGYGLSFNKNDLRIRFDYFLHDGIATLHTGHKSCWLNNISVSCYCEVGNPNSGIQILIDNPTLAHTQAETKHRVQVISHNKFYVPNVEYTTSDTKVSSNITASAEIILKRLSGNMAEVNLSIINDHTKASLLKVAALRFAIDDNIYKQQSIIFEMKNKGEFNDSSILPPIIIDDQDHA